MVKEKSKFELELEFTQKHMPWLLEPFGSKDDWEQDSQGNWVKKEKKIEIVTSVTHPCDGCPGCGSFNCL